MVLVSKNTYADVAKCAHCPHTLLTKYTTTKCGLYCTIIGTLFSFHKFSVAEPHHFYAAPAPILLHSKAKNFLLN
jgi:hypothetical protein